MVHMIIPFRVNAVIAESLKAERQKNLQKAGFLATTQKEIL